MLRSLSSNHAETTCLEFIMAKRLGSKLLQEELSLRPTQASGEGPMQPELFPRLSTEIPHKPPHPHLCPGMSPEFSASQYPMSLLIDSGQYLKRDLARLGRFSNGATENTRGGETMKAS